jgi:hypothetical protein
LPELAYLTTESMRKSRTAVSVTVPAVKISQSDLVHEVGWL